MYLRLCLPCSPVSSQKKSEARARSKGGETVKPVCKGPPPKPNRFGILPGYQWGGNDRGKGFEDKVLESLYSTNYKKEAAYRWSSVDMTESRC